MRILEVRGEEAIVFLADLMMPIQELVSDAEVAHCVETQQLYKAFMFAMKNKPKTVLELLAICEGVPVEEYNPSLLEIPLKAKEIIENPMVQSLFTSQAQTTETSSGSVTENTEAEGK